MKADASSFVVAKVFIRGRAESFSFDATALEIKSREITSLMRGHEREINFRYYTRA